jgi:hypothetical protein
VGTIWLSLDKEVRCSVVIGAIYVGVPKMVTINPLFVRFKLRTNDTTSPVNIEKATGLLSAVHTGHALLETDFGGMSNFTCVNVNEKFDITGGTDYRSRCEELLASGEELSDGISRLN